MTVTAPTLERRNHFAASPIAMAGVFRSVFLHGVIEDLAEDFDLSAAQARVLPHLTLGRENRAISAQLHISNHTVRTHVRAILAKAQMVSRRQLTEAFLLRLDATVAQVLGHCGDPICLAQGPHTGPGLVP